MLLDTLLVSATFHLIGSRSNITLQLHVFRELATSVPESSYNVASVLTYFGFACGSRLANVKRRLEEGPCDWQDTSNDCRVSRNATAAAATAAAIVLNLVIPFDIKDFRLHSVRYSRTVRISNWAPYQFFKDRCQSLCFWAPWRWNNGRTLEANSCSDR